MGRVAVIIFIISCFLFNTKLFAKNPPPGTGTSDIPANILIMLDNSGSMSYPLPSKYGLVLPLDVQTDSSGNIYVLEYVFGKIKVFDSEGNYLRIFGGFGTGCSQTRYARQFAIHNDQIYIADYGNRRVVVLDLNGGCIRQGNTQQNPIQGIAVNNDYIFVSGMGTRIESLRRSDLAQTGSQSFNRSFVRWAFGLSMNNAGNRLIIANGNNLAKRFTEFVVSGNSLILLNTTSRSRQAWDADYDSNGNIFGVDSHRLRKFNSSLVFQSQIASGYSCYCGLYLDGSDNIYVADYFKNRVVKYNSSGSQQFVIGGGRFKRRMTAAKNVIKKIVKDTNLISGANFGLMEWGSNNTRRTRVLVPISTRGAAQIFNRVNRIYYDGGTRAHYALRKAEEYYTGQTRFGKVPNYGEECALNFIIFISDGEWGSNDAVVAKLNSLRNRDKGKSIKTFMIGFAVEGDARQNYFSTAQAGGTDQPLFAENEDALLSALRDAIKQATSGRLTFTTPAITADTQTDDYIYQATFVYESSKQWEGSVKKYKLDDDGKLGDEVWDASETLNTRTEDSRRIWTAGISTTGLNNFTTTNRDEIRALIYPESSPTDTQIDNLINFIRGEDTYNQDNDNRTSSIHKLADIYHSNIIVVGPPDASTKTTTISNFDKTDANYRIKNNYESFKSSLDCGVSCQHREEVIITGANNGILHVFKTDDNKNGEELWGFIPPAIMENLSGIPSSKANATNPIYGIDSSPVVRDIFFDDTPNDNISNPRWRTILINGFGAGGNGFFALDITNLENPKQIFSIKNDSISKDITHWDSDGNINNLNYSNGKIDPELDYRKLGETWSTPRIIRIKVDSTNDGQVNPTDKWVAVFGGGYNGSVDPDIGSAVFVVDLENEGKLLKVIDIEDKRVESQKESGVVSKTSNLLSEDDDGNKNRIFDYQGNDICFNPSSVDYIVSEFTPSVAHTINYKAVGDLDCVDKVEFEEAWPNIPTGDDPSSGNYTFTRLSNDVVNGIPADLTVITADGTGKANYNGALIYANDLEGKVTKINLTENYSIDFNSSSSSYKTIKENISTTTLFEAETTSANGRYIFTKSSATINNDNNLWLYFGTGNTQKLREDSASIQNRVFGIKDKDFPNFVNVSPTGNISKCTKSGCPAADKLGWYKDLPNRQKITAEPTVHKDRVFFPIYEPSAASACSTGKAILEAYDTLCGDLELSVHLGSGVLSKVVVQGDKLYVGIAGKAKENIGDGFTSSGNLITGNTGGDSTGGAVQTQYWREID